MDFFERRMRILAARYARVVYRYPAWFVIIPLVTGLALSSGLLVLEKYDNAMYMYTPLSGKGKFEEATLDSFWPVESKGYAPSRMYTSRGQCFIYVTSKNETNLLTVDLMQTIADINSQVIEDIQIIDNGTILRYEDLCMRWKNSCYENPLVRLMNVIGQSGSTSLKLTYPSTKFGNQKVYLASTIGGVSLDDNGTLESAKAWMLVYQLKYFDEVEERRKNLWQKQLEKHVLNYKHPLLKLSLFHDNSLDEELNKTAHVLAPRLIPSFIILLLFSAISTIRLIVWKNQVYLDFSSYSSLVAIAGVLSAGLGVSSSIGLLSFLGVKYSRVVAIMPFLIISVRIDNTFLMISNLASADRRMSVEDRVAEAMSEASVSIFLTVATDALSFGIGCITDFPAVQLFCLYSCTAIWVTFTFQLTLLFSLLVYEARREANCMEKDGKRSKVYAISAIFSKIASIVKPLTISNGVVENGKRLEFPSPPSVMFKDSAYTDEDIEEEFFTRFFSGPYSTYLMNQKVQVCVVCLFILYVVVSVWGCLKIRHGLEPYKLLPRGSYATGYYENLEQYMWKYGTQVFVTVSNPGNLSDYRQRDKVVTALQSFADSSHGIGMVGMDCWLFHYLEFITVQLRLDPDELDTQTFNDYIKIFLGMSSKSAFSQDVVFRRHNVSGEYEITAFRCLFGIKEFSSAIMQTDAVTDLRRIASIYEDLNITTFNKMWHYVDQYQAIMPNIVQECGFGILCMVLLALLLVPKAICSLWVTFAILSVDMGVVGFMTLWGLNMDTVSMITIVMSIGFSVDFSAHIAYAYSIHVHSAPLDRIRYAIGQLGWPIMQGAISTLLGVLLLADLGSYLINSFFKTVFLVIVSGLLHALLFLPVFITLSDEFIVRIRFKRAHPAIHCNSNELHEQHSNGVGPAMRPYRMADFVSKFFYNWSQRNEAAVSERSHI